ncbi:MAG: hypothetical protein ABT20_12865 [Rubrivivax sp. SCN 70-15]|nr:MAG: hypothetical protein ABT20_12865 [Rubrivivax sp. SCN 70-15]
MFALINAPANPARWTLTLALAVAQGLIWLVPLALSLAWLRGGAETRRELLQMLLVALLALGVGQLVTRFWPQPRPFALHLGHQFMAHADDPGFPSDHVTVFWSLAVAALGTLGCRRWAPVLLVLGLLVGWSRVYLGVHFPLDVLGAAPVALAGVLVERLLRRPLAPLWAALLRLDDGLHEQLLTLWRRRRCA